MGDYLMKQPIHGGSSADEAFAKTASPRRVAMYLDSAIIVKLLVREAESEWFEQNLSGQSFDRRSWPWWKFVPRCLSKSEGEIASA